VLPNGVGGSKSKPFVCSSLKPASKGQPDEMCYTFDVAKCDMILITCCKKNKLKCQVVMTYRHRNNSKSMRTVNDIVLILMLLMITMFSVDWFN
jgi:hypothetical protein